MAIGNMFFFDRALLKIQDGSIDLDAATLKAVLCSSSQSLDKTFVGSSGDARYADLTGQLSTANGYTAGGVTLTGVSLSRATSATVALGSNPFSWTITGAGITFKYMLIYADNANDDLIMAVDMDTGGASVLAAAGVLQFGPGSGGYLTWSQV